MQAGSHTVQHDLSETEEEGCTACRIRVSARCKHGPFLIKSLIEGYNKLTVTCFGVHVKCKVCQCGVKDASQFLLCFVCRKQKSSKLHILEEKLFFHLIFKSVFLQKKVTKDLNFSWIWICVK